ncbi:putative casparian strip membrane protein [Dioscorea sansibarensis]
METKAVMVEGFLRVAAIVLATMSALLVGLDTQTKTILFIPKKATAKDLQALWVVMIIASLAACYQVTRLLCMAFVWWVKRPCLCGKLEAWICLLLDQATMYMMFAGTVAATQASMVALKGVTEPFYWSKLCNIYTRFCFQIGGGLACALVASLLLVILSSISANHLVKLYPLNHNVTFKSRG